MKLKNGEKIKLWPVQKFEHPSKSVNSNTPFSRYKHCLYLGVYLFLFNEFSPTLPYKKVLVLRYSWAISYAEHV